MDLLLSSYNQKYRNGKRIIQPDYIIRKRERLLHICLNSPGCRFRHTGSCAMCDYGQGKKFSKDVINEILQQIKQENNIDSVLIGTLGSVFDEDEVPRGYLEKLFKFLQTSPINTVILESHYSTIDENLCVWLNKHLGEKDIVAEVGLESVDSFVQEKCLNKRINLRLLQEKIELLHRYNISLTANIFLGAPFLNIREQMNDAENSIKWAMTHMVDSVTIFPANIRKNTLLYFLYENKKYEPIQQWMVFELLDKIPEGYLNRIFLSWYGDWIELDENKKQNNLPPISCEKCKSKWKEFYHCFQQTNVGKQRKYILKKYREILKKSCDCYTIFENSFNKCVLHNREKRVEANRMWVKEKMNL